MLSCKPLKALRNVDDVLLVLDGYYDGGEFLPDVVLHQLISNPHIN